MPANVTTSNDFASPRAENAYGAHSDSGAEAHQTVSLDNVEEKSDGGFSENNAHSQNQEDDDLDDEPAGKQGYGWEYEDGFDDPEEEEDSALSSDDEDERYAKGMDKDKNKGD